MHIAHPSHSPVPPVRQQPLSILHVLGAFPVLSETFVSNEIRALRALGHRVTPLALAPHDGACQPEDEGFRAETVQLSEVPAATSMMAAMFHPAGLRNAWRFASWQSGIRPRSLMLAGMRTALVAQRHGCHHLHAHFALPAAATAIVAARLIGGTCSFTSHGYDIYGTPSDLPLKLAAADLVIAVCEDMRRDMLALAPDANVRMIPCGIDPDRFRPRLFGPDNGRLLAIGRLVEQKGYDILLAALAQLPPAERPVIDIVGGGPLEDQLRQAAASLGVADHLHFLGPLPSGWIAAEGPAYRGFVAPYRVTTNGDRDTSPMVAKEALAMGLPVVASALMGLKETVGEGCGRLVPPGNAPALAEALRWLNRLAPAERRAIGTTGRAWIKRRFSLAAQAEAMEAAFRSLAR